MLDFHALEKTVASLKQALDEYSRNPTGFIRDSCIQRFEYTWELSHKMLKRYLRSIAASPDEVDSASFPQLIRMGSQQGLLLNDWERWKDYRTLRGTTSHTYDERKAQEVQAALPGFLEEAEYLLQQLQRQQA